MKYRFGGTGAGPGRRPHTCPAEAANLLNTLPLIYGQCALKVPLLHFTSSSTTQIT